MMSGKKKQDKYGFITGAGYVQATNYVPRLAKQRRKYEEKKLCDENKIVDLDCFFWHNYDAP